MRSREYTIRLNKVKQQISVIVYADRSVEMSTIFPDGERFPRSEYLQTREEAAWVLGFSHSNGNEIERTFL